MGNLLGSFFGKSSKAGGKSPEMSETKKNSSLPSQLTKKPSLSEIIQLSPNGKPVEFTWKHGGSSVIVTGTFDNWSQSIHLAKDNSKDLWRKTVMLDPASEHQFKFVVDGVWRCSLDWDTLTDPSGNVNNIIRP